MPGATKENLKLKLRELACSHASCVPDTLCTNGTQWAHPRGKVGATPRLCRSSVVQGSLYTVVYQKENNKKCKCLRIEKIAAKSVEPYATEVYYTIPYYTLLYYTILYCTIGYHSELYEDTRDTEKRRHADRETFSSWPNI